ncbi:MAG: lactonase family protein [Bacteroidota bacterium]
MKKISTLLILLVSIVCNAQKTKLIIGTYTSGKSEGIYIYDFNTSTGDNKFVSSIKSSNPSFLAVSPDKKYLYAVNEDADSLNNASWVSAFEFDKKKKHVSFINKQPSGGDHPCHITLDKTGKWVIASNYTGGSFSIAPINKDGSISADKKVIQHKGKSINKERQEKAHVHQTLLSADNKYLLVADLGMDKFFVYDFDDVNGTAKENTAVSISAGSGPRHAAFHPSGKYVYLTEELSGTVAAFSFDATTGKLKLFQTISAVPEDHKGTLSGADIHVSADGKFVYASNRGELNNLVIYKIDEATGVLTAVGFQSTLGVKPRNFNFDPSGNFLLVANQDSDNIIIFSVNHETGLLTDTGKKISVPNPVCLVWVN